MPSHASLSGGFWAEALKTTMHVINKSPNKNLDHGVLEEAWSGKKPSYNHLHIFGCEAFARAKRASKEAPFEI